MNLNLYAAGILVSFLLFAGGCGKNHSARTEFRQDDTPVHDSIPTVMPDTIAEAPKDTVREEVFHIDDTDEALQVLRSLPEADNYMSGVFPSIAKYAPEYLEKLLNSSYSKFIVVDKARMKVLLYDRYGNVLRDYGMACSKRFGTKHKKADNRTPEGFFSVEGIYDSTDWLFTDDDGKTSKKKGQFGPRFIRLRIPNTSQIGIHGTCAPWSIGSRSSHGCIRVTNENILELVDLVEIGMPVIVLPGKKDRAVNREEGTKIAYFPTNPKYAIKKAELDEIAKKNDESGAVTVAIDSMGPAPEDDIHETISPDGPAVQPDTITHNDPEPRPETGG